MEKWLEFIAYNENGDLLYESKHYKRPSMIYNEARKYKAKHPEYIVIVQCMSDSEIKWDETL